MNSVKVKLISWLLKINLFKQQVMLQSVLILLIPLSSPTWRWKSTHFWLSLRSLGLFHGKSELVYPRTQFFPYFAWKRTHIPKSMISKLFKTECFFLKNSGQSFPDTKCNEFREGAGSKGGKQITTQWFFLCVSQPCFPTTSANIFSSLS